jgi:uncharacterized protein YjiS (DUF1127 family)
MGIFLLILLLVGAALALVTAVIALRAYLRLRRARTALNQRLNEEISDLARRTGEMERSLSDLDARAQQLPIRISELQQSLSTLRVLAQALAARPRGFSPTARSKP